MAEDGAGLLGDRTGRVAADRVAHAAEELREPADAAGEGEEEVEGALEAGGVEVRAARGDALADALPDLLGLIGGEPAGEVLEALESGVEVGLVEIHGSVDPLGGARATGGRQGR